MLVVRATERRLLMDNFRVRTFYTAEEAAANGVLLTEDSVGQFIQGLYLPMYPVLKGATTTTALVCSIIPTTQREVVSTTFYMYIGNNKIQYTAYGGQNSDGLGILACKYSLNDPGPGLVYSFGDVALAAGKYYQIRGTSLSFSILDVWKQYYEDYPQEYIYVDLKEVYGDSYKESRTSNIIFTLTEFKIVSTPLAIELPVYYVPA